MVVEEYMSLSSPYCGAGGILPGQPAMECNHDRMRLPRDKNRLNPAAIAVMAARIPSLAMSDHKNLKLERKQL